MNADEAYDNRRDYAMETLSPGLADPRDEGNLAAVDFMLWAARYSRREARRLRDAKGTVLRNMREWDLGRACAYRNSVKALLSMGSWFTPYKQRRRAVALKLREERRREKAKKEAAK